MIEKKIWTIGFCLILLFPITSSGQTGSQAQAQYAGKDFYFSSAFRDSFEVLISSKYNAHVQFYYTNNGASQSYSVTAGKVRVIDLLTADGNYNMVTPFPAWEIITNKSLHITADSDIVVSIINLSTCGDDGTTLYPTDQSVPSRKYYLLSLRKHYCFPPYAPGFYWPPQFDIIATCDSVVLQIIPSVNTLNHLAHVPFNITMNKGQSYVLSDTYAPPLDDLSGTEINVIYSPVNVPIHVFTNQLAGNGLDPNAYSDPWDEIFEELPSVDWWSNVYPVSMPMDGKPKARIKVISAAANNQVYFDTVLATTLNAGEVFDTLIDSAVVISAPGKLGVAMFLLVDPVDTIPNNGDADMVWMLNPQQGTTESYFRNTLRYQDDAVANSIIYLNNSIALTIVSEKNNVNSIMMDGIPLAGFFQHFPHDTTFMYANVPLDKYDTTTTHHFVSEKKVFAYFCKVYTCGGYSYHLGEVKREVLIPDTVYKCPGQSVPLSVPGAGPYYWSTGAQGSQINAADSGLYQVFIGSYCGGEHPLFHEFYVVDTQFVYEGQSIYDTLVKCSQSSVSLSANTASEYLWSTGDTINVISVDDPGSYSVREYSPSSGCTRSYAVHHFEVQDYTPSFKPMVDTTGCEGDRIVLHCPLGKCYWSTGDTSSSIVVTTKGLYAAYFADSCGTIHSDSVNVAFEFCPDKFCNIEFPSAFSPNNDGHNDLFRPVKFGTFTGYYVAVFDRWGKLLWQSYKIDEGWDGTYNGSLVELGTYMYMCQVSCPKKGTVLLKGDVTLIR